MALQIRRLTLEMQREELTGQVETCVSPPRGVSCCFLTLHPSHIRIFPFAQAISRHTLPGMLQHQLRTALLGLAGVGLGLWAAGGAVPQAERGCTPQRELWLWHSAHEEQPAEGGPWVGWGLLRAPCPARLEAALWCVGEALHTQGRSFWGAWAQPTPDNWP